MQEEKAVRKPRRSNENGENESREPSEGAGERGALGQGRSGLHSIVKELHNLDLTQPRIKLFFPLYTSSLSICVFPTNIL